MSWLYRGMALLLVVLLTACPKSMMLKPMAGAESAVTHPYAVGTVDPIVGQLDWPASYGRQVQADISEIGNAATIALIDAKPTSPSFSYTVASSITDTKGNFSMTFSNGYTPVDGLFYLEAYKGLKAGTNFPNRVNSDLARMRTLVQRTNGIWTSLTGKSIKINSTTTALCVIFSQRTAAGLAPQYQIADPSIFIGRVDTNAGTDTTPSRVSNPIPTVVDNTAIVATYVAVVNALKSETDPFRAVTIDVNNPNMIVVLPKPLVVGNYIPAAQVASGTLCIIGSGFAITPSSNSVAFTKVDGTAIYADTSPTSGATVSVDQASMSVVVPVGAVSGPVSVTVAGHIAVGPTFYLALQSGHEALDPSGNLYVANEGFGTIAKITPQGAISTFYPPVGSAYASLSGPRNLTVCNQRLYVVCAGTKKGVQYIDISTSIPAQAVDFGFSGAGPIADPRGICFDPTTADSQHPSPTDSAFNLRLYVTEGSAGKVWSVNKNACTAITVTGTALNQPRACALGQDASVSGLYIANNGSNNVIKLVINNSNNTATSTPFLQGLSSPWGLAFDALGNFYVANNTGNSVYRWVAKTQATAPYADLPSPGGMCTDRNGYVYAIDNNSNNIYRITSDGDAAVFASGISSPTGIAKVGNLIYVLSSTNNSLATIDTTTSAISTITRGFNIPYSMAYDSVRDCFYVSNQGNGVLTKVMRSDGSATNVMTGISQGIYYQGGRLYTKNANSFTSYDVTNWAAPAVTVSTMQGSNLGIARDTSNSTGRGTIYYCTGGNRILAVMGEPVGGYCAWGSKDATNRIVEFKNASTDPTLGDTNLSNPWDVAVDGSGHIWVISHDNNKLLTYNPDRSTYLAPITDGISNPYGISWDGSKIWVCSYSGRAITGYDPATGAKTNTINIPDQPLNLTFYGGSMYAITDNGVAQITSYASAPSYNIIYSGCKGYRDLVVRSNGIYVGSGAIRFIPNTLDIDLGYLTNYQSPSFMFDDALSGDVLYTDNLRYSTFCIGSWGCRFIGLSSWMCGPNMVGVDSNGNIFGNSVSVCSGDMVTRMKAGTTSTAQEEWFYQIWNPETCWMQTVGPFAGDGLGNMYVGVYETANIGQIDSTGVFHWVANTGNYGINYKSVGLWAEPDGSALYQSMMSHHRVEKITISGTTGTRSILNFGLSAAEM